MAERLPLAKDQCRPKVSDQSTQFGFRISNGITLVPTTLPNGDLAFVLPAEFNAKLLPSNVQTNHRQQPVQRETMWRPW